MLLVCLGAGWGYLEGYRASGGELLLPLTALQLLWITLVCAGLTALRWPWTRARA